MLERGTRSLVGRVSLEPSPVSEGSTVALGWRAILGRLTSYSWVRLAVGAAQLLAPRVGSLARRQLTTPPVGSQLPTPPVGSLRPP